MSDITRNGAIIDPSKDPLLAKKHGEILLNEKFSRIEGLRIRLSDLKRIEEKKLELEIDCLEQEIKMIQDKLNSIDIN